MKQRPNDKSELTRLKRLAPEDRAEIYSWAFPLDPNATGQTNTEIRGAIQGRWGIALKRDGQLSDFWPWQRRQMVTDHLGMTMSRDEEELQDRYPNLSRDKIRDTVLKRAYAVADMSGDTKLALQVVAKDLMDKRADQDERRLILEERAKQADAAEKVIGQNLSPEEKAERIRKIFKRPNPGAA